MRTLKNFLVMKSTADRQTDRKTDITDRAWERDLLESIEELFGDVVNAVGVFKSEVEAVILLQHLQTFLLFLTRTTQISTAAVHVDVVVHLPGQNGTTNWVGKRLWDMAQWLCPSNDEAVNHILKSMGLFYTHAEFADIQFLNIIKQ